MTERNNQNTEENLENILLNVEKSARKVKEIIVKNAENLDRFPKIDVFYRTYEFGYDKTRTEEAIILDKGSYKEWFGAYPGTNIKPKPMRILTKEGIFNLSLLFAHTSSHHIELVPDWENKTEIDLMDYFKEALAAQEAMNKERQTTTANI